MCKRVVVLAVVAFGALTLSSSLGAQDNKWNSIPPPKKSYKVKTSSGPAPRRDISGTWDAGGMQEALGTSGAEEHPAFYPGRKGGEGGHPDETGIEHPLPYTPAGLAALNMNHPSGPGVRQVHAALANDPADKCDPLGFPYMELWEFRTVKLVETATQVIYVQPFYGNYRIIWTDGRELPTDPEPRWNGYSVGKWVDDYTFVVETTGLNPKSWLDHAGRPHSDQLRVEETYHRVDHDDMELTMKIIDPKYYSEPWLALNKLGMHLMPGDFDIQELLCSPTEMSEYNEQIGSGAAGEKK